MKLFVVFAALLAIALAAPSGDSHVEILKLDSNVEPEGYNFVAETSDGTSRQEEGKVKDFGTDHAALVVHGSFSWKDEKDGKVYTVTYVADENGFQPAGEHIPAVGKPVVGKPVVGKV